MNLKEKLNTLAEGFTKNDLLVKENFNIPALNFIKKILETSAKRGKKESSIKVIKLVQGPNYQIMTSEATALELSDPNYIVEELKKEGLQVSLKQKDNTKHLILTCKW